MVFGTDTLNRFGWAEFDPTAAYNLTNFTNPWSFPSVIFRGTSPIDTGR